MNDHWRNRVEKVDVESFDISKLEVGKSLTLRLVDQEIMRIIIPLASKDIEKPKDIEKLLRSNYRFSDELIESAQQFFQRNDLGSLSTSARQVADLDGNFILDHGNVFTKRVLFFILVYSLRLTGST
jgi:hypothetical protein